ncbi:putative GNAT superfamily acetyltransferase [Streptomyces sp. PanSC9]|nr:putative GNAT superfamily acetyltransferase [Streptomyces sp. PanSC9]
MHNSAGVVVSETRAMTTAPIRAVHGVAEIAAVTDYFSDVWHTPRTAPPYPAEVLHSLIHAGGAVHVALDGTRVAGAAVVVLGPQGDTYSLVAAADQGLGLAVKRAQRAWALDRGARTMRWTFDPLVGRNARFNLAKLGAVGTEYLVDFYGPMADGVNDGDESDRLTVTWDLTAPAPAAAPPPPGTDDAHDRRAALAPAGVSAVAPDGGPLTLHDRDGQRVWCRVPDDIVALRAAAPALALRWRHAVRAVFTDAFARGCTATGMSRDGWYTLTHQEQTA